MPLGLLTKEEQQLVEIYSDPVLFSRVVLGFEPRWYQEEMLRHPSRRKVIRAGRRIGKTACMAVDMIYHCYTRKNQRCVVVAPYDNTVEAIFNELRARISASEWVAASIVSNTRNPQRIEFGNGSWIRGFTAGTRSGGKGDSVRAWGADRLYFDEVDRLSDDDIDSVYGLVLEKPDIVVWGASTPTGRRGTFYKWCNTPSIWTEFHYSSHVNPNWNDEMEREARLMFTEVGYVHEVLAEWGEAASGVYPKDKIDAAKQSYSYYTSYPGYHALRTIGVDFDKYGADSQIVVVEYKDGKIKVINRTAIPRSEYTYDNVVKKVIDFNAMFMPEWIYLDAGQGEHQIEALHKYGLEHPESGLDKKVKRIHFGSYIEVMDPATRVPQKQPIKPYMVNMACLALERDLCILNEEDVTLWRQLENYSVVRVTASGQPIYTSTQEHAHDAWMLAIHALTENHPEIMDVVCRPKVATRVASVNSRKLLDVTKLQDDWARSSPAPAEPSLSSLVRVVPYRNNYASRRGGPARTPKRTLW